MLSLLALIFAAAVVLGDAQLIERALRGQRASMALLVRRLMPVIQARVRVYLSRRPTRRIGALDQDDLIQDVWLTLMKDEGHALRRWDAERGMRLEGYVGLLAKRQLSHRAEAHRALKRGAGVAAVALDAAPERPDAADPEGVTLARSTLVALRHHLEGALSPRGRLVLAALYDDGLEVAEAAAFLSVNTQVIYNWQHKIRTLSRDWLAAQSSG